MEKMRKALSVVCLAGLIFTLIPPLSASAKTTYNCGLPLPAGQVKNTGVLAKNNSDQDFQLNLLAVYPTTDKPDNYTRVRFKKATEREDVSFVVTNLRIVWSGDKVLYETDGYTTIKYSSYCHKNTSTYKGVYFSFSGNNPDLAAMSVYDIKV